MKGAFPSYGARAGRCAREGAGGLVVKVPLVEPVTGPVPQDVMDAHLAQVDPVGMA
jgi:hypothetical protein